MRTLRRLPPRLAVPLAASLFVPVLPAHADRLEDLAGWIEELPCCEPDSVPSAFWVGRDSTLTLRELARHAAPVLWFSPDEPLLNDAEGADIRIPEPFPFEEAPDRPVVYFRVRSISTVGDPGEALRRIGDDKSDWELRLDRVVGIDLDYFFYYSSEEGLNAHRHDVESLEVKIATVNRPKCPECPFMMGPIRFLAKAHGVLWYDNTLEVVRDIRYPLHVMVEEAKHASCPDRNADGFYTPGFDVNVRINDAWGVRDIIRTGGLFAAGYQSWMSKPRQDEHRVFPPLPEDNEYRKRLERRGEYAAGYAVYELRPFPTAERAEPDLVHYIEGKGPSDWPATEEFSTLGQAADWFEGNELRQSLGVAVRGADSSVGVSFTFPLFVVSNFQDPIAQGYLVNRVYLQGDDLGDFGYTALYTPSASRWIDPYFAVGFERAQIADPDGSTRRKNAFVSEAGLKFRVNMQHSPLKFLALLGTDFWGLRAGIQYREFWEFDRIGYVFEFGAGSF